MVILLSLEEGDRQIISGFPEYVLLSTNVPSSIFYTLDGTEPDENSEIFVDRITLLTDGVSFTLKAVAISGLMSSTILEQAYFTQQDVEKDRLIGKEGINILPHGQAPVDSLSFDYLGNPVQETVIPLVDLDIIGDTTNNIGEDISGDTTLDFINFDIKTPNRQETIISTPNGNNIDFDPRAAYIIMDGSTQEALDSQTVRVINRPHGTLGLNSSIYSSNMEAYNLNTSNFVRYMIDSKSGKITFYYRDSRENRWLKSTQKVEGSGLNLSSNESGSSSFVFRWVEDRAQSLIY